MIHLMFFWNPAGPLTDDRLLQAVNIMVTQDYTTENGAIIECNGCLVRRVATTLLASTESNTSAQDFTVMTDVVCECAGDSLSHRWLHAEVPDSACTYWDVNKYIHSR